MEDEQQVLEFRLPDLGEGLTDAELVSWAVAVGDRVELNQTIAEVETAKAQVALPSPYAGTVVELLARPGDTVLVGAPLIRVASVERAAPERQSVLVGYGPEGGTTSRRARAAAAKAAAAQAGTAEANPDAPAREGTAAPSTAAGVSHGTDHRVGDSDSARRGDSGVGSEGFARDGAEQSGTDSSVGSGGFARGGAGQAGPDSGIGGGFARGGTGQAGPDSGIGSEGLARDGAGQAGRDAGSAGRVAAIPAARKLARELGIELSAVAGTGPDGIVMVEDVRRAAGSASTEEAEHLPIHIAPPVPAMRPEGGVARATPAERETRTPVSGIRKRTAAAMVASARDIPQASTFVTTDFTGSMELLDHLRSTSTFAGLSLTPLALIAKATLVALSEFPEINAVWDEANQEIATKHYVNLGIAVATERGLLVPNLKEAQTLSLRDLCREIGRLAESARAGTAAVSELTGGTFTISNVGVFGVDTGVPLVNPGEAAILCLGSIRKKPWVHRDELAVRWVTTLGLSFDHRLIDGEQAARFLASIAALVEDPLTLLGRV
ncbi:dihydrolipoamide acetyltransferase family protein [Nocardia sp. NPDC050406]|uniref:dihydrolipoamide acetyltransferase family protein n=1 Tax=Nocardia sp. NPDC050406 TaxID=3364318 RepID=UPI003787F35E